QNCSSDRSAENRLIVVVAASVAGDSSLRSATAVQLRHRHPGAAQQFLPSETRCAKYRGALRLPARLDAAKFRSRLRADRKLLAECTFRFRADFAKACPAAWTKADSCC